MILDSTAEDILYTSYFSGISGNYLKGSISNAGLDPNNLPDGDKSQMNFESTKKPKTWKDIWGSGQGIGRIDDITSVEEVVSKLEYEMLEAIEKLNLKVGKNNG